MSRLNLRCNIEEVDFMINVTASLTTKKNNYYVVTYYRRGNAACQERSFLIVDINVLTFPIEQFIIVITKSNEA